MIIVFISYVASLYTVHAHYAAFGELIVTYKLHVTVQIRHKDIIREKLFSFIYLSFD